MGEGMEESYELRDPRSGEATGESTIIGEPTGDAEESWGEGNEGENMMGEYDGESRG